MFLILNKGNYHIGRRISYTLTDEDLELLIKNWGNYEDYAVQNLAILEDSLSELRRFNPEHISLSDTRKASLDRFLVTSRNMSCYSTKAQAYIKQINFLPDYIPVGKDNFEWYGRLTK